MTFQACKIEYLNSMTFQVFHDRCEPCYMKTASRGPPFLYRDWKLCASAVVLPAVLFLSWIFRQVARQA